MISHDKTVKVTKRKWQGSGAHEEFIFYHNLLDAIPDATRVLRDIFLRELPQFTLNEEVIVPNQLQY
jgi:hypothetical protein